MDFWGGGDGVGWFGLSGVGLIMGRGHGMEFEVALWCFTVAYIIGVLLV